MSIERDETLARLLLGMRDGCAQALKLLSGENTGPAAPGRSGPEARGKAAGIMQAQIAMIDAVLPPCKDEEAAELERALGVS